MTYSLRSILPTAIVCLSMASAAYGQEQQKSVILSVTPNVVKWADVYKVLPERPDDPYFHVRVFEHHKGWEPWRFKELVFHMAVTPGALEASRSDRKARIYSYKDVEIRAAYRRWLDDTAARIEVPVCETDILRCIERR